MGGHLNWPFKWRKERNDERSILEIFDRDGRRSGATADGTLVDAEGRLSVHKCRIWGGTASRSRAGRGTDRSPRMPPRECEYYSPFQPRDGNVYLPYLGQGQEPWMLSEANREWKWHVCKIAYGKRMMWYWTNRPPHAAGESCNRACWPAEPRVAQKGDFREVMTNRPKSGHKRKAAEEPEGVLAEEEDEIVAATAMAEASSSSSSSSSAVERVTAATSTQAVGWPPS